MTKVISKFNDQNGNHVGYMFWCEGCDGYHGVWTEHPNPVTGAKWSFNEDEVKPTFRPSLMIQEEEGRMCHSFVTDGKIEYLSDCTHSYAGEHLELKNEDNVEFRES